MIETKSVCSSKPKYPEELKQWPQWIVWRLEHKPNETKPSKIPYNPKQSSTRASSTNKDTWSSFTEAYSTYESGGFSGVGFVFSKDDPFLAIDFDHCVDDGKLNGMAYLNVSLFNSYTEVSQSGSGLHIICKGKNPSGTDTGHKKGDVEFYSTGRFFALTGNVWQNYFPVTTIPQIVLKSFYEKYFSKNQTQKKVSIVKPTGSLLTELTDEKIIEICQKAKNSSKFIALWSGNTTGYNSQSEAEMALASILAFYTQDVNQLQRLLRNSGLSREKMDRVDYITHTIEKATSGVTDKFGDRPKVCFFCKKALPLKIDMDYPNCPNCGKRRRF